MTATQPIRAVSAAIYHEGRFLLVERANPPAQGLYAYPGGRVEQGETLEQAVRREVIEETGALLSDIQHLVDLELASETESGRIEFILSVHKAGFAGGKIVAGDDAAAAFWFTIEEMVALPLAGSVLEIAQQIVAGTADAAVTLARAPCASHDSQQQAG